ncbi:hypothetical protein SAMN04488058_101489 [Deinococcus reticulitermitis]|uniref:Uncharacterized protein n=1 Tax=Deinococcus reticulitermitis TaxID=856736 RepID=A0A1H6T1Z8_9DEIO|nr:hypothetical protein [Deinococcus reticulitermitis]SEI74123.1 hypothetical protein SAMN04488058_101489 [Deinococcus reticulitermitis]
MTDPKDTHPTATGLPSDTGLPDDAGNGMSSRSGYYDESESGRTETPVGQPRQDAVTPDAVPTSTGDDRGLNETGTSFGTAGSDDKPL